MHLNGGNWIDDMRDMLDLGLDYLPSAESYHHIQIVTTHDILEQHGQLWFFHVLASCQEVYQSLADDHNNT